MHDTEHVLILFFLSWLKISKMKLHPKWENSNFWPQHGPIFFLRLSYSSQIKTKLKIIYFVDLSLHMYRVSTKKVHFSFINQWLPSLVCDWPIYTEHTLLLCEFWSAMICWCLGLLYYSFKLSQKELTMKTQAQCLFWILVCHDLLLPVTSIP